MKKFISQFKNLYFDLVNVSRLTKTKNKKIKILLLALLVNSVVLFDILIIVYFSSFFSLRPEINIKLINYFLSNSIYLPFIIFLRFLFLYLEKIIITKLQFDVEKNLREHLISEVFKRGNISTADAYFYINVLSSHVGNFYNVFSSFVSSIVQIISFTIYLFYSNSEAVFIFSIGILILFIPTYFLTKKGREIAHKTYLAHEDLSKNIEKIVDNLFLIKIIKKTILEIDNFKILLKNYHTNKVNEVRVGTIVALIPNFFTIFSLSLLLIFFNFSSYLTLDFIGILLRLFQSLGIFNKNINFVTAFHVYLQKIKEIESNKEFVNENNFEIENKLEEEIAIKVNDVDFKYLGSEDYLFEKLNIKIPKYKHIIITGFNGSGKSTLLGLLSGVLYPINGNIQSYSSKFGYVSANPMILKNTLKFNLLYGLSHLENIKDELLIKYLEEFKVFTNDEELNLNKIISNKTLSMGQMQKISFIRTLVSGVDILILDESTSNLDYDSRKLIFNILEKEKLTIINSTHTKEELKSFDYHINIDEKNGKRIVSFL